MFGRLINHLEETLLALLLAAMTLVTFGQVVARYVFNSGAVWALELTTFLFAWLVLIGISFGVRVNAHIGVDLLVRNMKPKTARWVGLVAVALCTTYALILMYGGYQSTALLHLIGIEAEDLPIPAWIPHAIVPVGFALLAIRFAQVGWRILRGTGGMHLADEAGDAIRHLRDNDNDPSQR